MVTVPSHLTLGSSLYIRSMSRLASACSVLDTTATGALSAVGAGLIGDGYSSRSLGWSDDFCL